MPGKITQPRTQLSGYITVPDQHQDQEDQPEYTVHQENQQEEVPNASTDGKIKKTQPRGVKKVPDQKEDYINREEDDLGRRKDDLERQFILESSWFEETT